VLPVRDGARTGQENGLTALAFPFVACYFLEGL
jgi:hypothetical protein